VTLLKEKIWNIWTSWHFYNYLVSQWSTFDTLPDGYFGFKSVTAGINQRNYSHWRLF